MNQSLLISEPIISVTLVAGWSSYIVIFWVVGWSSEIVVHWIGDISLTVTANPSNWGTVIWPILMKGLSEFLQIVH